MVPAACISVQRGGTGREWTSCLSSVSDVSVCAVPVLPPFVYECVRRELRGPEAEEPVTTCSAFVSD